MIQNMQHGLRHHPAFKPAFAFPVKVRQKVASCGLNLARGQGSELLIEVINFAAQANKLQVS